MSNELNKNQILRRKFLILHWSLTLLITPILGPIFQSLWSPLSNQLQLGALFELYMLFIIFGVVFSIPTLAVYLLTYYCCIKLEMQWLRTKVILILLAISGAVTTIYLIGGSWDSFIAYSYASSTLFFGVLLSFIYNSKQLHE